MNAQSDRWCVFIVIIIFVVILFLKFNYFNCLFCLYNSVWLSAMRACVCVQIIAMCYLRNNENLTNQKSKLIYAGKSLNGRQRWRKRTTKCKGNNHFFNFSVKETELWNSTIYWFIFIFAFLCLARFWSINYFIIIFTQNKYKQKNKMRK